MRPLIVTNLVLIKHTLFAQYNYGNCLQSVEGFSLDLKGAAHCFKAENSNLLLIKEMLML
jgi:hypothetical protein